MRNNPSDSAKDNFTGRQVFISSDHNYIHKGKGFTLSGKSGSIAAGSTFILSMDVPAGSYIHMRPTIWSSTANVGELRIAEGSTYSAGSGATPRNRNRNSLAISLATLKTGVTMTVEGTALVCDLSLTV